MALFKIGGIVPKGSLSITSNGTYDVKKYASANVNVNWPKLENINVLANISDGNAHGVSWTTSTFYNYIIIFPYNNSNLQFGVSAVKTITMPTGFFGSTAYTAYIFKNVPAGVRFAQMNITAGSAENSGLSIFGF